MLRTKEQETAYRTVGDIMQWLEDRSLGPPAYELMEVLGDAVEDGDNELIEILNKARSLFASDE